LPRRPERRISLSGVVGEIVVVDTDTSTAAELDALIAYCASEQEKAAASLTGTRASRA
jgi:hypothetical protein